MNGAETVAGHDAWYRTEQSGRTWTIRAGGRWVLSGVARFGGALNELKPESAAGETAIDLSELEALDTVGAVTLIRLRDRLQEEGLRPAFKGAKELHGALLEAAEEGARPGAPVPRRRPALDMVTRTGQATIEAGAEARDLLAFFGLVLIAFGRLIRHPGRLRVTALATQIERSGLNSMPIVGLLSFLIGVVLAYQGAEQLRRFGAELFVVNLLGVSILREIGILMTAIIIAGRSGAAFTAQIGTMKVSQEIDAMRTLGLDPIDILVIPRILALMIALPLLGFFADIVGLIGGAVMANLTLGIGFDQFITQFRNAVSINHFWVGLVKAPVFAFIIALVGCFQGLKVGGSAESVGRLTTRSVVEAIFLVIAIDAVFSVLFAIMKV